MSDNKTPPPPEAPADLPASDTVNSPAGDRSSSRNLVPWFYGAGFIVLALAILYLWQNPATPPAPPPAPTVDLQPLRQQIETLSTRLTQLEQRPAPQPAESVDLAPLAERVAALEKLDLGNVAERLNGVTQRLDGLEKLSERVNALEARPVPDLAPLQERVAQLEQRPAVDPQVASRLDAISSRLESLTGRTQTAEANVSQRMQALEARIGKLETTATQITNTAARASRLARIQSAEAALDAGQALGQIPGAPPAVARFASTAPPTLSSLRLAFPAAERAAHAASQPSLEGKPFMDRVWDRAQGLVTVRQGDKVLVGDNSAGPLARARVALEAGDLEAAVQAVSSLQGAPAQAMAPWLTDARALLDARAALSDMAANA
ncbi:MAG: mitofilin family membrane protein [Acetobacteraceae bacterium]